MQERCCTRSENLPGDVAASSAAGGGNPEAAAAIGGRRAEPRRWRPIPTTLLLSVLTLAAYASYERIGTTANADSVEFTQNLAGGFLAIGMTPTQPGFVLLSALDQGVAEVNATRVANRVAGMHTIVDVQSPRGTTHARLRGPQVLMVLENGTVESHEVDWTVEDFNSLREAADCSHEASVKKRRCGAPFADLQEALAHWPDQRVPQRVRAFLAPFKSHRSHE